MALKGITAATELEKAAVDYATKAIRLDKQGSRGMAVAMYQRAIEVLLKLVQLYPNYELNRIYIQRAMAYQERVKVLQSTWNIEGHRVETSTTITQKASYDELVIKQKPNVKWQDIVNLENAKRAIKEAIIYPVQRPDLFPLGWPRGILLFGPPGCGKTLLGAAVATEINAAFISVDAASIMSKWLGEAEKNVARLFTSARKSAEKGYPCIIFIDELDSLVGIHSTEVGGEARVRNQFLKEMDGILDKGQNLFVYVMGATNKPWRLDQAFLRRFQKRILVPLPDYQAQVKMLQLYTRNLKLAPNVDLNELARLTIGFSGCDIRDICQSAQLRVVAELFESGQATDRRVKPRPISFDDFEELLKDRRPSVSSEMVKLYDKWFESYKAL